MTFTEKVYAATRKIPLGKVTTYKRIAEMCGNVRAVRAVGNILHNNPFAPVVPVVPAAPTVPVVPTAPVVPVVPVVPCRLSTLCSVDAGGIVVPCHRVVSSAGRLAKNFGYNGIAGQTERLTAEGVDVINGTVDLAKYGW
jgi:alkylated DNA nucleotide flippase Atl1